MVYTASQIAGKLIWLIIPLLFLGSCGRPHQDTSPVEIKIIGTPTFTVRDENYEIDNCTGGVGEEQQVDCPFLEEIKITNSLGAELSISFFNIQILSKVLLPEGEQFGSLNVTSPPAGYKRIYVFAYQYGTALGVYAPSGQETREDVLIEYNTCQVKITAYHDLPCSNVISEQTDSPTTAIVGGSGSQNSNTRDTPTPPAELAREQAATALAQQYRLPPFIEVPAGAFIMGSSNADVYARPDEKPQRTI
ncbi:MAG: hypothetical protein HC911_09185, partial [Chloroflexaceae bacterium]|nr:hypothetical protein [Chloroflexaceae bacterium]